MFIVFAPAPSADAFAMNDSASLSPSFVVRSLSVTFRRNFDHPCIDGLKNGTTPLFIILPTEPLRPKLTVTSAALAAALARSSLLAFLIASGSLMSIPAFFRVAMYSQSRGYISIASFALDSQLFFSLPALSALSMSMNVDCEIPASFRASEN